MFWSLSINNVDVTLHVTKDSAVKAKLYVLILEEKRVSCRLSNSKISIIEPVKADS
jgi:hypothetical protein